MYTMHILKGLNAHYRFLNLMANLTLCKVVNAFKRVKVRNAHNETHFLVVTDLADALYIC